MTNNVLELLMSDKNDDIILGQELLFSSSSVDDIFNFIMQYIKKECRESLKNNELLFLNASSKYFRLQKSTSLLKLIIQNQYNCYFYKDNIGRICIKIWSKHFSVIPEKFKKLTHTGWCNNDGYGFQTLENRDTFEYKLHAIIKLIKKEYDD